MHLDSKQSQFRPGESQRSKNVPDVLFVDEDGNPIEAGAENLIYIDEAGNEVPEELAIRLLESGKYIDSRLLYDDDMIRRSNSYASSGLMGSNSQAIFNASKGSTLGTQSDYQQSTKHSSSYISKQSNYESKQSSYDSKPSSYATSKRSSSYNTVAQQAQLQSQLQAQAQEMARVQAQLFAEAHAQAQAKAEEIAQIEADAQSNYGGSSTINTDKQTPTITGSKSSSQTTVNRTIAPSTDRRLPTVPPVKKTESYAEDLADFDSYLDDESERKTNLSSYRSNTKHSTTHKSSSKSSQDKKLSMKEQVAKQKGEIQHGLIKNQLLKKQQELLEQQELERKQQEIIARQQGLQQQQQKSSRQPSSSQIESHSNRNEIPSVLSRVSALSTTDQRSSRGSGQSRYSGESSTVTGSSSSRQQQSSSVNSTRTNQTKQSRISDLSRVSESSRGTDGPAGPISNSSHHHHHQMIINRSASNIKQTPKVTAHIPVPQIPKSSRAASSKSMRPNTAASSDLLTATNQPALKTNREYTNNYNNYDILQMRQVGQLSGNKIIRNFSEANLSELENYYESEDAKGLEFEPTNLDIKPNHFIDPFSPDLFKDEIIDIDFGAIDAFTEALNAQISSEKNGTPPPKNLQFPSHILSSNHASFIDNQLLLGDSSINVGGGDVHSGVNVQFLKPSRDSNSYYTSDNTANTASTSAATSAPTSGTSANDDASQYSHTNSFGSLIDVQKNRSNSTHDFNTTNRQSVLTSLDNLINTTTSRTASTRYSNSTYVR